MQYACLVNVILLTDKLYIYTYSRNKANTNTIRISHPVFARLIQELMGNIPELMVVRLVL